MIENREQISRKPYTKVEDELIYASLMYAMENGIKRPELAEHLELLLDRTKAGILFKLHKVAREIKSTLPISEILTNSEEGTKVQVLKSETQIIQTHLPSMNLEEFSKDDVGKRVKVKAYNMKPYGVFCVSEEGKTGLLLPSMVSTEYVTNISDFVNLGDEFLVIVEQDRRNPDRTLLNAKVLGNIIAIKDR